MHGPIAELPTQALWDASADGLLLVDEDGIIVATNRALEEQFGYSSEAMVGEAIEVLLPRDHRSTHVKLRRDFAEDPRPRPMASRNLEGLRSDGSTFPVNVSLAPVATAAGSVTFAAVRDLTDRVEHERTLADALRRRAMAEDHDRIANDLHDSVIQRLFALGLSLQGLPTRIEDPEVSNRVSAAVDALDEIILDIRTTIYGLRNTAPEPDRLRASVLALANEVESSLGFAPDLSFGGPLGLVTNETLEGHVLAVVREGLSNAGRHSGASEISVSVRVDDDVVVEIADNGCGIDPATTRSSGLSSLRQRAEAYGGSFRVERPADGGTRLVWRVPADQIP